MKLVYPYFKSKGETSFRWRDESYAKMNIDICFYFGWKPEDIIFFTDFDWNYRGVTVIQPQGYECVSGVHVKNRLTHSKIWFLRWAYLNGLQNDLWWVRDIDLFQLEGHQEAPSIAENQGAVLARYGESSCLKVFGSSLLITPIFGDLLAEKLPKGYDNEETFLTKLVEREDCIGIMPRSWAVNYRPLERILKNIQKYETEPRIRYLHVKPLKRLIRTWGDAARMWRYLRGQNEWHKVFVSDDVFAIFKSYGVLEPPS
jgi:hypothetical protein